MFQRLLNSGGTAHLYIIGLLIVALVVLGFSLSLSRADVTAKNNQIETLQLSKAVLQSDLDGLTLDLRDSESENQRLRKDIELTAALLSKREHDRRDVDKSAADAAAKTNAIIKDSDDEAVTNWVATPVPDDLNWLLEHASACANRDNRKDGACIAASGINESMRNSNVLRQNQPRSL